MAAGTIKIRIDTSDIDKLCTVVCGAVRCRNQQRAGLIGLTDIPSGRCNLKRMTLNGRGECRGYSPRDIPDKNG